MRRGLTLIEVLAVLVVLGLASGLSLGLSGSRGAQTRQNAMAAVAEAMDHARVVAAREGGAWVMFGTNIMVSAEDQPRAIQGEAMPRTVAGIWLRALPSGWRSELDVPGGSPTLFVDALGCSSDARIALRNTGQEIVLRLEGLSGRLVRDREAEARP